MRYLVPNSTYSQTLCYKPQKNKKMIKMSALNKIACMQERRDEAPNIELAKALACKKDIEGIKEIAENLWNKDKNVQSDCISVLYWIGSTNPELVQDYVSDFIKLLSTKNNRLIWGVMISLSTIASKKPEEIFT